MSAQDLSVAQLLSATDGWNPARGAPIRHWLERHGASAAFLPLFDRLRATLANAPPEDSELGKLGLELEQTDFEHDDWVRFLVHILNGLEHHPDQTIRAVASRAKKELLPEGASLVNKSWPDQAGRADVRAPSLEVLRPELAAWPLPGNLTVASAFDGLQASSRKMGTLLARRVELTSGSNVPTPMDLLAVKRNLIGLIQQIFDNFRVLDSELTPDDRMRLKVIRDHWDNVVDQATAIADRRRARKLASAPTAPDREKTDPG